MKIKPLYDNIVVRPKEVEQVSPGGIVLQPESQERPNTGEVVDVGEGKILQSGEHKPLKVKVGDNIMFGKNARGEYFDFGGEKLLIMKEEFVIGIISS